MYCGDDQMTGLGGFQRQLNLIATTQFAGDNNIRCFAHGIDQALFKTDNIGADFSLGDGAAMAGAVAELDRIFQRHGVYGALFNNMT